MFKIAVFWLTVSVLAAFGDDSVLPEPGPQRRTVNDLMAQRAEKVNEAIKLKRTLPMLWLNPEYTSEEIEVLRKRREELKLRLEQTEREIMLKVAELPKTVELKAKIAKLEKEGEELQREAQKQLVPPAGGEGQAT